MRLIDADKFAEDICNLSAIDEHSANAVIFLLHEQPTIDIKTEVAREIFAEIENTLANKVSKGIQKRNQDWWLVIHIITKLKNKYTEVNK